MQHASKADGSAAGTDAPRGRSVPASRLRIALTVLATLLVVSGEFALLSYVYHRAEPVRAQRVITADLRGRLTAVNPNSVSTDLTGLAQAGLSDADLSEVRAGAETLAAHPGDPTRLAQLRSAAQTLSARLAQRQHRIDGQADLSYVVLLILVSVGWMLWFRRLVGRHRALQRKVTEQEERTAGEQRLAALVRNSADVIAVLDADSKVTFVTPSAQDVLGWRPEELIGMRWLDVLVEAEEAGLVVQLFAGARHGIEQAVSMRACHRSGRELYLEGTLTSLLGEPAVDGIVLTVRDVTQRRELEQRFTHQAFHDSLTDLANRQLFADRLEHALTRVSRKDAGIVVLFFDLDDFKQINDSVGHSVGDQVLTQVGVRLAEVVRTSDTAARLGGDEFAVLMEDTDLRRAHAVADRLQAALAEPVVIDESAHTAPASIGLAHAFPGEHSGAEVLRNAEVAMYLAKDRGKHSIAIYEPQLHATALQQMQLQADLQRGLRSGQLVLHYQPIVELDTGAIVGFEALVRWEHPEQGLLPPIVFIPVAERTGLIGPLGSWVLREACVAAVALQSEAHRPTMSVNVAAAQLSDPGFVTEVLTVLEETGLPPDRLCLEVTESSVLADLDATVAKFRELREHGLRIAIDDFGTGYSSLSYLAKLPVDVLKVDKSFVDNVTKRHENTSVIEAILTMSAAMRLTTVAEGIEHTGQAQWLAAARCQLGQGYLWSRAVPFDTARDLLDRVVRIPTLAGTAGDEPDETMATAV